MNLGVVILDLHLEPITRRNRKEALKLRVAAGQETFVETVSQCLSEAGRNPVWKPVGICSEEQMVGFAMYGYFWWEYFPHGRLWLDRLLIDAECQGKGYGRAAMADILKFFSVRYPGKDVYLSVTEGNNVAAGMYKEFGFRFNGEKDIHGEDVMVKRYS